MPYTEAKGVNIDNRAPLTGQTYALAFLEDRRAVGAGGELR